MIYIVKTYFNCEDLVLFLVGWLSVDQGSFAQLNAAPEISGAALSW